MVEKVPMVSIIVPVYNVEKYLEECLMSIEKQSCTDFELILIDDGSKDGSYQICERFEKTHPGMKIKLKHFENAGLSAARNRGLALAEGMYVTFVDSDDFLDTDYVNGLLSAIKKEHADIAVCTYKEYYSEKEQSFHKGMDAVLSRDEALYHLCRNKEIKNFACGKLFRKDLFSGISFPEGRVFEDIPVIYKAFYRAEQIAVLNKALYCYRIRKDSITGKSREDFHAACQRSWSHIERYQDLGNKMPELRPVMLVELVYVIGMAAVCYHGENSIYGAKTEQFVKDFCAGKVEGFGQLDLVEKFQMKYIARNGLGARFNKLWFQTHRIYKRLKPGKR